MKLWTENSSNKISINRLFYSFKSVFLVSIPNLICMHLLKIKCFWIYLQCPKVHSCIGELKEKQKNKYWTNYQITEHFTSVFYSLSYIGRPAVSDNTRNVLCRAIVWRQYKDRAIISRRTRDSRWTRHIRYYLYTNLYINCFT